MCVGQLPSINIYPTCGPALELVLNYRVWLLWSHSLLKDCHPRARFGTQYKLLPSEEQYIPSPGKW